MHRLSGGVNIIINILSNGYYFLNRLISVGAKFARAVDFFEHACEATPLLVPSRHANAPFAAQPLKAHTIPDAAVTLTLTLTGPFLPQQVSISRGRASLLPHATPRTTMGSCTVFGVRTSTNSDTIRSWLCLIYQRPKAKEIAL